ncbi:hypothetical protein LTR85_003344 [Meristemomyces frigidus]|nr:hypothetical protein LTR85_003344 [Meristemomyces frigidus]
MGQLVDTLSERPRETDRAVLEASLEAKDWGRKHVGPPTDTTSREDTLSGPGASSFAAMTLSQTSWGKEANGTDTVPQRKSKVKTRPPTANDGATSITGTEMTLEDDRPSQHTRARIAVEAESLALFGRMYSLQSGPEGTVRWEALVGALTDAGLTAVHGGGSATTLKDKEKGSVVLHKPHPEPTVNMVMLRSTGKRLAKWFGWDADTFSKR